MLRLDGVSHHIFPIWLVRVSSEVKSLACVANIGQAFSHPYREHTSLVESREEAHKDGRGQHVPKDLHVIRKHRTHLLSIACRFTISLAIPALCWEP
jgi:hypothetical protein